jgi:hypothetical protein
MPSTDLADIRDTVRDNAVSALDNVRTNVRSQAASAGETLTGALTSALDSADKATRQAAQTAAKNVTKNVQQRAQELQDVVLEKTGRAPKRGHRKVLILGGVALVGVAVAALVARQRAQQAPNPPAEPTSTRPGDA